jgi:hypothetical protein
MTTVHISVLRTIIYWWIFISTRSVICWIVKEIDMTLELITEAQRYDKVLTIRK